MIRSNPPWSDKILKNHWAALERRVGPELMPRARTTPKGLAEAREQVAEGEAAVSRGLTDEYWLKKLEEDRATVARLSKSKPKGWVEYGTGHYGCVMPTNRPGTVIKVTTDLSEATFVAAYLSLPQQEKPVGIIPYHKIVAIRSESHMKRPVFVLWREEAQHVGANAVRGWIKNSVSQNQKKYYVNSLNKVEDLIGKCLEAARTIRNLTHRKPNARELLMKGVELMDEARERTYPPPATPRNTPLRIGWFLNVFNQNAGEMQSEPMGNYVGQALHECLHLGILLADVHLNNIGMPTGQMAEEIGMSPIITDPGHAIALNDRFDKLQVEDV